MRVQLKKLPGKAGWCAAIHVGGRHVATVADPNNESKSGAEEAAKLWDRRYRRLICGKQRTQ